MKNAHTPKSLSKTHECFDALMSFYYTDKIADLDIPCLVVVGGSELEVKYDQEGDEFWSWKGVEKGVGHFHLLANHKGGQATLHHFEGSKILDGYWAEGGIKGMWRIQLSK